MQATFVTILLGSPKKLMGFILIYLFLSCYFFIPADAQSLTLKMNRAVPLKGSSLVLSCELSFTSGVIQLWKGSVRIANCTSNNYSCTLYSGYSSTANQRGVFTTISSLNREHEGTYLCKFVQYSTESPSNSLTVVVYTIPSRLDFTQVPNMNVDLSVTAAKLQCTTSGCTYPPPLMQWLTQSQTTSSPYEVYKTVNPTVTGGSCAQGEQIYTSILDLQQNTIWSDNRDKILIFSCRIEYPDSSMNLITSGSQTIRFAVRVTEAYLQQKNQNITSTLTVNSGDSVTLTCVTGTSRPAPIIGWYIGSQSIPSETSLTFTPSNTEHKRIIYCQAYNVDPNLKVDSNKFSLYVRVRVTEAFLQQNNQNITSTLIVDSGEPVTLTCVTGTSQPDPIIGWYIGSRSRGNGISLVFTPSTADHNEVIFCQAYNIDPNLKVDSNKPRLIARGHPRKVERFYFHRFIDDQIELRFVPGFNGGPEQTFVIEYMSESNLDNVWKNSSVTALKETESQYKLPDGTFFVNVIKPSPGQYIYRMYSWNVKGRSPVSDNITVTVGVMDNASNKNPTVEAVAGGVGAAIVVIAVIIIVVILLRRRGSCLKKKSTGSMCSCFRSKRMTNDELHSYANTEINPQTVKPIYEELNKGNTEPSVYDKISRL